MSFVQIGGSPPPSFTDPVGILLACHKRIAAQLEVLEGAAAALDDRPEEALVAAEGAIAWLETDGARHTQDEDASFFPRLYGVADLLGDLNADHRATEAILLSVRTVLRSLRAELAPAVFPEARTHIAALAAAYRAHIADEEARFIPLARALDEAELRAIGLEMRIRRGGDKL